MKQLLSLPALAILAAPVFAQDPAPAAEAKKVDPLVALLAENLPKLKDAKWEGAHSFNAVSKEEGTVAGSVSVSWQDLKHFKVALNVKLAPAEGQPANPGMPTDVTANVFADGTHLWVISPLIGEQMGGMEGVKVELAVFEKMIPMMMSQMGGGMAAGPGDVQGMIEGLSSKFTVKEEGSTPALRRLVFEGDGWKGDANFDAKTWFPMAMQMGSEEEGATVSFNTTAFNLREAFPEGTFAATGVDATKVMDLTPMLQSQLGALGGGGADEDLEF
jgi:hypothetical protein